MNTNICTNTAIHIATNTRTMAKSTRTNTRIVIPMSTNINILTNMCIPGRGTNMIMNIRENIARTNMTIPAMGVSLTSIPTKNEDWRYRKGE